MPSCLGIYTDKNMIKYAKITTMPDRVTGGQIINVDNYGVKFYDNLRTTFEEITDEVGIGQTPLGLTLSNEDYYITQVFSNLKRKDMLELVASEYSQKKGGSVAPASLLERRIKLAQNAGSVDKSLALCVTTTKAELTTLNKNYEDYKIASISPLSVSIKNLFENQAIDEEAAVINIESKTTITLFHRGEIQYINSLPMGAYEIINKLAEKYNSTAKAYEACKKVSAYLEDSAFDMDDESRDIIDVVIPVLYDIRQQVLAILAPYVKDLRKIYITGTGAIINNIDLYFGEIFTDIECEILTPYFIRKDSSNVKDIMEVNSALALALDGIGMVDEDFDFHSAYKKVAGSSTIKDFTEKFHLKEKIEKVKEKTKAIVKKLNSPAKPRRRRRRNVDFDAGLISSTSSQSETDETEELVGIGMLDSWLIRLATFFVSLFVIYWVGSTLTNNYILDRNKEVTSEISKVNAAIANAEADATYVQGVANQYAEVTEKLSAIIAEIRGEQIAENFNIPNFLSKIMFVIPANVQVTSIDVNKTGAVEIKAQSGQYAQLGYFVSKIKLEEALLDVDMKEESAGSDIKIVVRGVLP